MTWTFLCSYGVVLCLLVMFRRHANMRMMHVCCKNALSILEDCNKTPRKVYVLDLSNCIFKTNNECFKCGRLRFFWISSVILIERMLCVRSKKKISTLGFLIYTRSSPLFNLTSNKTYGGVMILKKKFIVDIFPKNKLTRLAVWKFILPVSITILVSIGSQHVLE